MSRNDKRKARAIAHRLAVAMTGKYVPEWDRLDDAERKAGGGGMAGWVMYAVNPYEKNICKLTGRVTYEHTLPYSIPRRMPSGMRPPRLDKRLDLFKKKD